MNFVGKVMRRLRAWLFRNVGNQSVPRALVKNYLVAEPWFIDSMSVSDSGILRIEGWSFPRSDGLITTFSANGTPFETSTYPVIREGLGKLFWQRRDAAKSGFTCSTTINSSVYVNGIATISRSSDADKVSSGRDYWYFPDPQLQQNLPSEDRRFRVIGNREASGFLNTGATDFFRLDSVARALLGKRLWEAGRVLDWGVGCGRLARYWPGDFANAFVGCDVDHANVDWCTQNLSGKFVNSNMTPPLPFEPGSFDLIYGISIFTHLKEALQFAWLEELRRVTASGGWVLTTIHGETAIDFFRLAPPDYVRLLDDVKSKGILVGSTNTQLDGHVDHRGEYVNVFHSRAYILERWSEYFDIVALIPGYIFTHDLVVLRKR